MDLLAPEQRLILSLRVENDLSYTDISTAKTRRRKSSGCRRIWRSVQTAAHGCRPSNAATVCCGQTLPSRPPG